MKKPETSRSSCLTRSKTGLSRKYSVTAGAVKVVIIALHLFQAALTCCGFDYQLIVSLRFQAVKRTVSHPRRRMKTVLMTVG